MDAFIGFIVGFGVAIIVAIPTCDFMNMTKTTQYRHKRALETCNNKVLQDNVDFVTCQSGEVFQWADGFTKPIGK
jgi:hypothetical protein